MHKGVRSIDAPGLTQALPAAARPPRLQGDRNDPFGSYLAGLRLGTGF